jgi:hypothetical protein
VALLALLVLLEFFLMNDGAVASLPFLKVSSKGAPNSMSLYPISFAQSSLLTYINKPKRRHAIFMETGILGSQ